MITARTHARTRGNHRISQYEREAETTIRNDKTKDQVAGVPPFHLSLSLLCLSSMSIAYYVSGHGFGHACRAIPVLEEFKRRLQEPRRRLDGAGGGGGGDEQGTVEDDVHREDLQGRRRMILCSSHPRYLFPADLFDQRTLFHRQIVSSEDGVVQVDAVTVDVEATARRLRRTLEETMPGWLERESCWLREQGVRLVVGDVPFLLGPLCASQRIPCVLISNFLWDSIYRGLADTKATDVITTTDVTTHTNDQEDSSWSMALVDQVEACYRSCWLWLREAGWIESLSFTGPDVTRIDGERRRGPKRAWEQLLTTVRGPGRYVIDVPPVVRRTTLTDRRTVLESLVACHPTWPADALERLVRSRILLVTFGGHLPGSNNGNVRSNTNSNTNSNINDDHNNKPTLPAGWIALLVQTLATPPSQGTDLTATTTTTTTTTMTTTMTTMTTLIVNGQHPAVYLPDLTVAADLVLGKLGYGTCGDCIAAGRKPMIYVRRQGFVEEEGLLRLMHEHNRGRALEMPMRQFQAGHWRETVERAHDQFLLPPPPSPPPPPPRPDQPDPTLNDEVPRGDVEVVDVLLHIMELMSIDA